MCGHSEENGCAIFAGMAMIAVGIGCLFGEAFGWITLGTFLVAAGIRDRD